MRFDPTYNTLMAVGVGVSLVLLVAMGRRLVDGREIHRQAWAAPFMAIGGILILLGGVMTVTWPLSGPTAFDNITFGEPVLACGVLLVTGAALLGAGRFWRPEAESIAGGPPVTISSGSWAHLGTLLTPLSWFAFAMGLALIAIAFIGPFYTPWAAPPQEPISSEFSDHEWIENAFISLLYVLVAIGCLLLPFALSRPIERARGMLRVIGVVWAIAGIILTLFGAMNYYTHSGMYINLNKEAEQQQATSPTG